MAAVRAQVIIHTADTFPANYVTNSWCIDGTDPIADVTALTAAFQVFYRAVGATLYSSTIAATGHEIKWYDLPGVKPNYPVTETTWSFASAPTGTPLPAELAICASMQGARTPGFPQARRRGRVYLGPWGTAANSNGRIAAATVTTIVNAMVALRTAINAASVDTDLAIWSVADQAAVPVAGGWVDNVFDVQRRRGVEETSRTTWT